jgi:uncharacterized protein YbaP (TraB family)
MSFSKWFSTGFCLFSCFVKSHYVNAEPLYWQASDGKTTFMIIGTIHVGNKAMYPLPTPLMDFLKDSDGLVVEADLSTGAPLNLPASNLATKQVLNNDQQQALIRIAAQLGMKSNALLQSPPWAVALQLQISQVKQLGYDSDLGVDQQLISQAQQWQRPLLPLETLQYQVDLLANFEQNGAELLTNTLDNWDEANRTLPCLFESWRLGDELTFAYIAQDNEVSDEINDKLKLERNKLWASQLTDGHWLPNSTGNYVIAVGALHLMGKHNLLELLAEQGFTIKQLSHAQSAQCLTSS